MGAAHTQHGKERGIDGASGFYRFLVFQDENCLPTSPSGCGGCGGPGAGFGSLWGLCAFRGGEQRRSEDPTPPSPKHPGASLTLPPPCQEPNLYSPFLQNYYFFSSFLGALRGDFGAGVAEGLPRPPWQRGTPGMIRALPPPRVAQGPSPVTRSPVRCSEPSAAPPPPPRPPPPPPSRSSGGCAGCAGLPSSIYSRAPVTSGFAARGESQPTRVFLLCL